MQIVRGEFTVSHLVAFLRNQVRAGKIKKDEVVDFIDVGGCGGQGLVTTLVSMRGPQGLKVFDRRPWEFVGEDSPKPAPTPHRKAKRVSESPSEAPGGGSGTIDLVDTDLGGQSSRKKRTGRQVRKRKR